MCLRKARLILRFVVETRIVYLNTMIELNSNLPIFILHLYFFKDFTNPLRRANFYTYLPTVDSKHIYPKRWANLTCTEVSPKVYGRIWVVLKSFWFSYFNSGLFAGLYNISFSITRVSLTQKTLLIRSHSRKGITCYSLGQALSFKLYRN